MWLLRVSVVCLLGKGIIWLIMVYVNYIWVNNMFECGKEIGC